MLARQYQKMSLEEKLPLMGAVAHGRVPSQKIAQLSLNNNSRIFFIPTRRELNSLSIYICILFVVCGVWLHVMQVDVFPGQSGFE